VEEGDSDVEGDETRDLECRIRFYWEQIAQGVRKAQAKEEERRRKDEERRREDEEDRQTLQAIQEMIDNGDKERLRTKEYRDTQDNEHEIQVTALQEQVTIADQGRQEAQEKVHMYQQELEVAAGARQRAEDRAAEAEGEFEALQRRVQFLERARDGALNRAATASAELGSMEQEQEAKDRELDSHRKVAEVKEEKASRWRRRARAAEKLLREGRGNGPGAGQRPRSEAGGPGVGCTAVTGWVTTPAQDVGTGHGGDKREKREKREGRQGKKSRQVWQSGEGDTVCESRPGSVVKGDSTGGALGGALGLHKGGSARRGLFDGGGRSNGNGSGGECEWGHKGSQGENDMRAGASEGGSSRSGGSGSGGDEIVGEKEADKGGNERSAESQQAEQRLRAGAKLRRILVGGSASSEEGGSCQGSEVESVQGVGAQRVEGKVKIFYCKWNGELGEKGRWEKERKYEGELSVGGGYARVCSLRGRVVDTRQLMEAEFVDIEYLEKGNEMEIGKVKVVLRESWLAEESESDYGE
jgi:hypothetical protein